MQMSGFSKVEMSAPRSLWRHGGDGGVDDGGTGSAAGYVPAGGAAPDAAWGGSVARAERAPGPAPVPRVPARRRHGPGIPPSRRPSNRQLATATREQALTLVRERYVDFGPTFAHQKLTEQHGLAF